MSPENTHKPIRIYIGGLILGVNTLYMLSGFFKLFAVVGNELIARGRGRLHRCGFCGPDSHVLVHVLRVRNAKKRSIQGKETLPQKRVRQRRESLTD